MFRIPRYVHTSLKNIPKLVRSRMLKSLAHKIRPFDRVLVPYLNNRASAVLLDFLENVNYPQYIALVAKEEVPGRPTVIVDDPLKLLIHGSKYHIYRPLDAAEIAYMRLKKAHEGIVFYGIFPFRRVHPRELGAYLLVKHKRFPRKHWGDHIRELVLKLEARYPWLVVPAAAFVEKISQAFKEHVHVEPLDLEPTERRLVGR